MICAGVMPFSSPIAYSSLVAVDSSALSIPGCSAIFFRYLSKSSAMAGDLTGRRESVSISSATADESWGIGGGRIGWRD